MLPPFVPLLVASKLTKTRLIYSPFLAPLHASLEKAVYDLSYEEVQGFIRQHKPLF